MEPNKIPVLFIILLMNYTKYNGFRLDKAHYSPHNNEREVLLQEGFRAYVLSVKETDLLVQRPNE